MNCSKCGKENETGRNFCAFCGAPLGTFCDRCQHVINPSDQYCGNCGLMLAASLIQKPVQPKPAARTTKKSVRQYSPEDIEELLSLRTQYSSESQSQVTLNQDEIDSLFL
jgi:predicted amidophosphoribosyltransferase